MSDLKEIPESVWTEVHHLNLAMVDLQRALVHEDDTYLINDLDKIARHRDQLVNALQIWRPEVWVNKTLRQVSVVPTW